MSFAAISAKPTSTQRINVSSSTQNVQVTVNPGVRQVRVLNDGTATVWIEFGGSSVAATSTPGTFPVGSGIPLAAGACEVYTVKKADAPIYAAAIAAGSTGYIYFTPVDGF